MEYKEESGQKHLIDYTGSCVYCGVSSAELYKNYVYCRREKSFVPVVQPITVTQPFKCGHPEVNLSGRCYSCGEVIE